MFPIVYFNSVCIFIYVLSLFQINTMDMKTSQFLTLHSKAIRDLCFNPAVDDGILLSVSVDKTVKMTSILSNAQVQT